MKRNLANGSNRALVGKLRSVKLVDKCELPRTGRHGMFGNSLRVGLFGIGLDAYWPQFKGLKNRLGGYLQITNKRLALPGVEVVNLGLVDTPAKALEAGHMFRREDVDLIFLHVTTYALSSTVLPV